MAIIIETDNAHRLLNKFQEAIQDKRILTWAMDGEGDFTINRHDWVFRAWLHPYIETAESTRLIFGIIPSTKFRMTRELYGVYHGRLIATMLTHFDTEIRHIEATPLMIRGIDVPEDII